MGKRGTKTNSTNKKTAKAKDSAKNGVTQRGDTPIIEIAAQSDDSQILVTLRKVPASGGSSLWLSPVGWSDVKKSTLLDCYENSTGCEIIIPDTYASGLEVGDTLHVSCAALNVRGDVTWNAPETAPAPIAASTADDAAPAAGLLSRFLSRNTAVPAAEVVPENEPSDALRRTEEAQKLANEYRVQMEHAATAREEAQRLALDAARRAEDALQAEADRIAEMEKAAKAFAEAEAARQDEERRLDAERRAEELRRAEEARLIEEARQRELAIARAAERAEEKARLVALQEEASNQRAALAQHIETTRSTLHRLSVDRNTQAEALASLTDNVADKEAELSVFAQDLNAQKGSLSALDERLVIAAARESDADEAHSQKAQDAAAAERALEDAEAAVQAAMTRAQQRKSEYESLMSEKAEIEQRAEKAARDLVSMREQRAVADAAAVKAQLDYDTAQSAADGRRAKKDDLIHEDAAMEQEQAAHKAELDRLARDLDAALSRQDAAKAALSTLEEGGDVRAARQIMASVDAAPSVAAPVMSAPKTAKAKAVVKTVKAQAEKTHKISHLFGKKKAAALAVPAKVLTLKETSIVKEPVAPISPPNENVGPASPSDIMAAHIAANSNDSQNGHMRRVKFAAVGVGALALSIALGLGMSSMTRPDVQQSVSVKPAPSKVLAADTRAANLPESSIIKPQALNQPALVKADPIKAVEAVSKPLPKAAPKAVVKAAPVKAASVKVAEAVLPKNPRVNVSRMARKAARQDKLDRRTAKRDSARVERAPVRAAKAAAVPKRAVKTAAVTRSVPEVAPSIASVPSTVSPVGVQKNAPGMSATVTRDVQQNLQRLGYYTGAVDGVVNQDLRESMQLFTTIYDLPSGTGFNAELVTRLSTAVRELDALQAAQPVQVASIAAPVSPVETWSLPPASQAPAVAPIAKEAAVTKPAPVSVPDSIVEAALIKQMSVKYPSKAQRRNVYENVSVEITYDIAADGTVTNARVYDIDYDGRFASAFEQEALQGVQGLQFTPKTVNGNPVAVTGQSKRVRFQVE